MPTTKYFGDSIDPLYASLGDEGADRIWKQAVASYPGALREAAVILVTKRLVSDHLDGRGGLGPSRVG